MNLAKEKLDIQPLLTTKKILEKALKEGTSSELEESDLPFFVKLVNW